MVGTPPQALQVVPDTGSRELIISSTKCGNECPNKNKYNAGLSTTHAGQHKDVETVFGQGNVLSEVCRDIVEIADHIDPNVKASATNDVLEMKKQQIKNFGRSAFDGVMGLGKQSEARKDDTAPALLSSFGADEFSLCLGRTEGSPGILMLNQAPVLPNYREVNVVGDNHWAIKMSKVSVSTDGNGDLCHEGCVAIVDTGTSLIAGPSEALDKLAQQLPDVLEDCSNLHSLPNLRFTLDGQDFDMPPSTWVLKVESEESTTQWFGPFKMKSKTGTKKVMCVPAFMEINMKSQFGPVWILGMPFLREYAVKFDRARKKIAFAQTGPNTCSSCAAATGHSANSLLVSNQGGEQAEDPHNVLQDEPLFIDPNTILVPSIMPLVDDQQPVWPDVANQTHFVAL